MRKEPTEKMKQFFREFAQMPEDVKAAIVKHAAHLMLEILPTVAANPDVKQPTGIVDDFTAAQAAEAAQAATAQVAVDFLRTAIEAHTEEAWGHAWAQMNGATPSRKEKKQRLEAEAGLWLLYWDMVKLEKTLPCRLRLPCHEVGKEFRALELGRGSLQRARNIDKKRQAAAAGAELTDQERAGRIDVELLEQDEVDCIAAELLEVCDF